ncbi:hypothetical protein MalM25_04160 [Planctomycetes bacterium MalM25]|nr:hypothetical protein MalM25_04160 [Planctomycetes bacterium MalM25]
MKDNGAAHEAGFWVPFGRTARNLAIFSLALVWLGPVFIGSMQRSLASTLPAGEAIPAWVLWARVGVFGFAVISGVTAAIFGLLSLLGLGKYQGNSCRASGVFGFLLGGLVAASPLLLFPAVEAARLAGQRAQVEQQLSNIGIGALQLSCADESVILKRPGPEWTIVDGEDALRIVPHASIVALCPVLGPYPIVGSIGVDRFSLVDIGINSEDQMLDFLHGMVERLITAIPAADVSSAKIRPVMLAGLHAVEASWEATSNDGREVIFQARSVYWNNHYVEMTVMRPTTIAGPQEDWAQRFFESISLVSP